MTDNTAAPDRYGKVKAATIQRDIDRVRRAVRSHEAEATEAAWDKFERWLGVFPADDVTAREAELEAERDAARAEVARLRGALTEIQAIAQGYEYSYETADHGQIDDICRAAMQEGGE